MYTAQNFILLHQIDDSENGMKNYWYFVGIISSLVLIPNNYRIKLKRQTETNKSQTKYLKPQGLYVCFEDMNSPWAVPWLILSSRERAFVCPNRSNHISDGNTCLLKKLRVFLISVFFEKNNIRKRAINRRKMMLK